MNNTHYDVALNLAALFENIEKFGIQSADIPALMKFLTERNNLHTQGSFADALGCKKSTATQLIKRFEDAGLLKRVEYVGSRKEHEALCSRAKGKTDRRTVFIVFPENGCGRKS